ncbi:hypothetical protein OG342_17855 [Streptomyces bobili]|uniref:hypothetical protein n=1 Tax=Streptomyces bobili TaxID=67280 RepID=UPI00225B8CB3|nr:hypothetical protein [Streptomyces bobili]MCX5524709.1 hypothetical protein [Streptomyces bobili]
MAKIRGTYEYPDGLTPGQAKDGSLHHNLYDDGRLVSHAKFVPDDENEEDLPSDPPPSSPHEFDCNCDSNSRSQERLDPEEVLEALVTLIKAVEWAAPRIKRWWNNQALPLVRSVRTKVVRSREDDNPNAPTASATWVESAPSDASQGAMADLEENRASMSSEEAAARLSASIMARLFSDEQVRILRNARIEGDAGSLKLSEGPNFTPQQIREGVRLALEENRSLLTKETIAELEKSFVRLQVNNGMRSIEK